jgi:hypothetical protein
VNRLALFVVQRPILAWILAIVLIGCSSLGVAWFSQHRAEADRLSMLEIRAERLAVALMSQTVNGSLIGALSTLSIVDPIVRHDAQSQGEFNSDAITKILEKVGSYHGADGLFIVGADKLIHSSWGSGKSLTNVDVTFRPYVQSALKGNANVYAAIGTTTGKRSLYFAVPMQQTSNAENTVIGVVVARIGLERLDQLLNEHKGIAMLLSPQGMVFSSSKPEWIGRLANKPDPALIQDIRRVRQFGTLFDNQDPLPLGFSIDDSFSSIENNRHAVIKIPVDWQDPNGHWSLIVTEDVTQSIDSDQILLNALGSGIVLLIISVLSLHILRSHHSQVEATRQIEMYAANQVAWANHREKIAEANTQFQQQQSVELLGQVFLSHCLLLFQTLQGTFYVLAGDAESLALKATFGCSLKTPTVIRLGEGMLGQSVLEKSSRVLVSTDNSPWVIRSGLGNTRPMALFISPIIFQGNVLGALELAMLKPPSAEVIERIEGLVKILALNLDVLQRNLQTQEKLLIQAGNPESLL